MCVVDATHNTDQYDFKLTSLMVFDTEGRGIVMTWMISDREDAVAFTTFMQCVHAAAPAGTAPVVLLSDDDSSCYGAVLRVFPDTKHLLCYWHLEKAWRRQLFPKIHGPDGPIVTQTLCEQMRQLPDAWHAGSGIFRPRCR